MPSTSSVPQPRRWATTPWTSTWWIEPGATLTVRSTAATVAWSGTGTTQRIRSTVADGATFDWHLQPLVATGGCCTAEDVSVLLDGTGMVRWAEELQLGRCGEAPGHLDLRLAVDLDDQSPPAPPALHRTRRGGWGGPGVLGGHRAVGLVLLAGRGVVAAEPAVGAGWAMLALDGPGVLVIAVADDLAGVRSRPGRGGARHRYVPLSFLTRARNMERARKEVMSAPAVWDAHRHLGALPATPSTAGRRSCLVRPAGHRRRADRRPRRGGHGAGVVLPNYGVPDPDVAFGFNDLCSSGGQRDDRIRAALWTSARPEDAERTAAPWPWPARPAWRR